jgi:hypothetical protein
LKNGLTLEVVVFVGYSMFLRLRDGLLIPAKSLTGGKREAPAVESTAEDALGIAAEEAVVAIGHAI